MSKTSRALAALAALSLALTGCTAKADTPTPSASASFPPAEQLLGEGALAMAGTQTAHFAISVDGKIANLPLKKAEGDLTREGSAKGTATIEQLGLTIEGEFIVVNKKLYFKGATGGFQEIPLALAATVYDPSAILDPTKGVAKLLSAAKNPKVLAVEKVEGADAYKISLETDPTALAAIIPGAPAGVTANLWLDAATKKLVKGEFTIPASGSDPAGKVLATFTKYDAPVTISAP
ncbi:lipoprotein LprG [Allocatelliglobosispora scoriae]|uniref:Lipoprotein LprG n=1 Tax=Allocatelliglobosispora scoriae TaxID=643052 RepID=A0A841BTF7_9ACTN|nr:LppX_LprAFG lipoprotein [Allocatelliglobosispora scoriae]MBB5872367.1 lipoprotein LprG [Allocatelliglobosispora scoriae]